MMAARQHEDRLIDRLPDVRGRYDVGEPMSGMTWFRVGGPAEILFRPADLDDLVHFLRQRPKDVPVLVVGVGSNMLVRDGGVPGVVIRLGKSFAGITVDGNRITAGAGAMDVTVAFKARDEGIAGLEFMRGIPGTVGGALVMNAGAYGRDVSDILIEATAVDLDGNLHTLSNSEMGFGYRHADVDSSWIFVSATFEGVPGDISEIAARIEEINKAREDSQPLRTRTGGSTFRNPTDGKAWQLVDDAGCRGLRVGGAQVSEKHCNFLINTGDATAADLEALGEQVRDRVQARSGHNLHWEIRIVGEPDPVPASVKGGMGHE